jgi:hypothetical protein
MPRPPRAASSPCATPTATAAPTSSRSSAPAAAPASFHDGWLYHSTNDAVYRYKYTPGELVPAGAPELIVSGLPNGHQHDAKSFAFDGDGRLMVEVGSPANAYSDGDRALGRQGQGRHRVPQDPRRLLALRSRPAQPDPGRRLPFLHRPPPLARARVAAGRRISSWHDGPRPAEHRRPRRLRRPRQRRARRRGISPAQARA